MKENKAIALASAGLLAVGVILASIAGEERREERAKKVEPKSISITTQNVEEYTILTVMDGEEVEFQYEGLSTVWYSKEQDKRYVTLDLEDAGVVR